MFGLGEFKNVMVMGAGAVGGYFGGRIAQRTATDVAMIARGAHLKALKKHSLRIKSAGQEERIPVGAFRNPVDAPAPDLILFTVKSYDTVTAIKQISTIVSEETQVLTLQNGIENYPKLVDTFGENRVIQGFCKIGAGVPEPGIIAHNALGEVTIGEQDGSETDRTSKLKSLFEDAGVPITVSSQINREVWIKFSWNCLLNMITAVGNVTIDKIFEYSESEQLCYNIFNELRMVAKAEGVELSKNDVKKIIESSKELRGFETSTYQDRQKGKKMEYEAFTGAVIRLADRHGIEVPYNETLYALLKLIDGN